MSGRKLDPPHGLVRLRVVRVRLQSRIGHCARILSTPHVSKEIGADSIRIGHAQGRHGKRPLVKADLLR